MAESEIGAKKNPSQADTAKQDALRKQREADMRKRISEDIVKLDARTQPERQAAMKRLQNSSIDEVCFALIEMPRKDYLTLSTEQVMRLRIVFEGEFPNVYKFSSEQINRMTYLKEENVVHDHRIPEMRDTIEYASSVGNHSKIPQYIALLNNKPKERVIALEKLIVIFDHAKDNLHLKKMNVQAEMKSWQEAIREHKHELISGAISAVKIPDDVNQLEGINKARELRKYAELAYAVSELILDNADTNDLAGIMKEFKKTQEPHVKEFFINISRIAVSRANKLKDRLKLQDRKNAECLVEILGIDSTLDNEVFSCLYKLCYSKPLADSTLRQLAEKFAYVDSSLHFKFVQIIEDTTLLETLANDDTTDEALQELAKKRLAIVRKENQDKKDGIRIRKVTLDPTNPFKEN